MTTTLAIDLGHHFAAGLPELAVPWQAAETPEPRLLALDEGLAVELGLDPDALRSPAGLGLLTGTHPPASATPVAQAYAGHQFGGYSPRLGDGRALLLGEIDTDGTPTGLRDLHLKGSGRTPFSRGGDGFAAVGPMLREHVVSTAMHALGVPTTRSLAVVATGRAVQRDTVLPGAVLARVARSHLRVGTFQFARGLDDPALLQRLVDHAIARHHPHAADAENPALALFEAVRDAQADLVARWMLLGFVHGVLNTDNVTISGETIDYGPCAFLDAFDPATVFSSIDHGGRYAYRNQPGIVAWDLARLAESLLPLVADEQEQAVEIATASLQAFGPAYDAAWARGLRAKLGLAADAPAEADQVGADLVALASGDRVDFTGFFRALGAAARGDAEPARSQVLDLAAYDAWAQRWLALGPDADLMDRTNPAYVPRNHLVEEALDAATGGDLGPVDRLVEVLRSPYDERAGLERFAEPGPDAGYVTYCGT